MSKIIRSGDDGGIGGNIIFPAGNVGINTTSPNGKLEIVGSNPNTDGAVFGQPTIIDNNFTIQTYIDNNWAARTTYAGACCNTLALQPEVGSVMIGGVSGNLGSTKLYVNGATTINGTLAMAGITGTDQSIENNYGVYLHLGAWGVARTASNAVLVNTAYMADTVPWSGVSGIPAHIAGMNQWVNSTNSVSFNSITIPSYVGANNGIIYFGDSNASINRQSNNLLVGTAWTYIGMGVSDFFGNISYRLVSDSRLKKNIKEISNSMEILNGLKGVTFDWRYDEDQFKDNKLPHEKNDVGLIAQDVEKVLPQAVGTDPTNGYKNVAYTKVIPVLVEVAKEQQTQIVSLQSITTDFIAQFKAGLIETKKLIVDGVDILKKLNELSMKVESQQKQIEELKATVEEMKK